MSGGARKRSRSDLPTAELFVLRGLIKGHQVRALKDDGCNTNIISVEFFERNRHLFKTEDATVHISHSEKNTVETASKIIRDATIVLGGIRYTSNWAIAQCRYDVLLGMPWHKELCPKVDYAKHRVTILNSSLPLADTEDSGRVQVSNLGAKKFRSLLKTKNRDSYEVYSVKIQDVSRSACIAHTEAQGPNSRQGASDERLDAILENYAYLFRQDLPNGLPPERKVDHAIETQPDAKPPHRPLFQLSPAELLATKEYIIELLRKGKIRPSKSP